MIDKKIFNIDSIFVDTNFSTQEEVFAYLTKYFIENSFSNNFQDVYNGFLTREKEGSTAFVDGLGIPHSKVDSIINPGICVVKNKISIEWDSLDGEKTFFFIALAIPNSNSSPIHLKMLSSIARKLVDKDFKNNLLNAKSKEEIFNLLSNVEII